MKKIIFILAATATFAFGISACSDTKHEATCTYYVSGDSISYTDTLDVKYDTILGNYLVASQYVAYTYKESAKTNQGLMKYAIEECDRLALQTFLSKSPTSLSLSLVKQELYAANLRLFDSLGISNPDSIDLDPFTVHISLWNYTYKGQMFNSKIEVK